MHYIHSMCLYMICAVFLACPFFAPTDGKDFQCDLRQAEPQNSNLKATDFCLKVCIGCINTVTGFTLPPFFIQWLGSEFIPNLDEWEFPCPEKVIAH